MEEIFGWMKTVDRWFPAYAGIGGWIGPAWGVSGGHSLQLGRDGEADAEPPRRQDAGRRHRGTRCWVEVRLASPEVGTLGWQVDSQCPD